MINATEFNIDEETIRQVGLIQTDKPINAQIATEARVFRYPELEDVFIMESDLYGNKMPKNSCFLAFYGKHGLLGKHLTIDLLKKSTIEEIKAITSAHSNG
jgi:hypothetical protein